MEFKTNGEQKSRLFFLEIFFFSEVHRYVDFFCGWGAGCIETCIMFPANKIIFRQQLHGFTAQIAVSQVRIIFCHSIV